MSSHIIRTQADEIKSLKDNLRVAQKSAEDLRALIDQLNAEKAELCVALKAACDTFQPAMKALEAENAVLRSRVEDRTHEE